MDLPRRADPFKNSPIKGPGDDPVLLMQGRVVAVNKKAWTVDIQSSHGRRVFLDVPVASPYVDYRGAGFFNHPIQKALVLLAVPSDSSPPAVVGYLPAMRRSVPETTSSGVEAETATQGVALEKAKEQGKVGSQGRASFASYASGRPDFDEGDMVWRGPDGTFVILYESGIVAIGCSSIAQTLYLPLTNQLRQVAAEYKMMTPMGTVNWGLRKLTKNPTQHTQVIRIYADDQQADLRIRHGLVETLGEAEGVAGNAAKLASLGIKEEEAIMEVALSSQGFNPETGDALPGAANGQLFRLMVTQKGGGMASFAESVGVFTRKSLFFKALEDISLDAKTVSMSASEELKVSGGKRLDLGGTAVVFNGGSRSAAAVGDPVAFVASKVPFTGTVNGSSIVGVLDFTTPPTGQIVGSAGGGSVKIP